MVFGDVQGSSRVSELSGDTEASTGNSQVHGESSYGTVAGWIVTKCSYLGFGFEAQDSGKIGPQPRADQ